MQLKDMGKTRSATVALCIAAVALQIGFAPQIEVMGGRINFMLILACVFILSGDTHRATIAGFSCGIAYDLTASVPVGLMSLILTVACFISSGMFRGVQIGLNPNALRCTAIVMFAVNVLYGLLLFFMHVQTDLCNYRSRPFEHSPLAPCCGSLFCPCRQCTFPRRFFCPFPRNAL